MTRFARIVLGTTAAATFGTSALVSLPTTAHAQPKTGLLSGTVKQEESGNPVAGVEITLPDLNITTRSDSAGNFKLRGITVGKHRLIVRRLGLEPVSATLTLPIADSLEADILMRSTPTRLETIVIRESAETRRLIDFEGRRKLGFGYFVTRDVFDKNADRLLVSTLSGRIPGLRFVNSRSMFVPMSTRGNCMVQVILNGLAVYTGFDNEQPFDLSSVQPASVLGIEYYNPATTPMQYRARALTRNGSSCGTILIWTK
jgi:hypothetical protein